MPRATNAETQAIRVKGQLDISDVSKHVSDEVAEIAPSLGDLENRLVAFKKSILNNTKNHTELRTNFQKYCPDGEDATRFSALVFEHLLRTGTYFPRLARFLTDPMLSLPGAGNACKMVRHINAVALEVGKDTVTKATSRHRSLLFRIRTMSERRLLTGSEVLDVISELGETPRLVCSDIERSDTYRALWKATSPTTGPYDASLDYAFLEKVTKAFGVTYEPVLPRSLEESADPIAKYLLGLSIHLNRELEKDSSFVAIFNSLPRNRLFVWFKAVTALITNRPQTRETMDVLSAWLEFLRAFSSAKPDLVDWQLFYAMLAKTDISPASVVTHLETLEPEVLTETLLNHWIPKYLPEPQTDHWAGAFKFRFSHFQRAHKLRLASYTNVGLERMLLDVIVGMNEREMPTLVTTTHILELIHRLQAKGGTMDIVSFLVKLKERGVNQIDPRVLYEIVLEKMDTQPEYASKICSYISNSRRCYDPYFPIQTLIRGVKSRMRMRKILEMAARRDHLPAVFRTTPFESLLNARAELAHQIAYQFSLDESTSCRASARSVYYFYKYLQVYKLPIGPLMIKALVRAMITRPLSERRFVSTRRYVWLRSLIAEVEGEEVARRHDKIFWEWRGQVIADAKRRWVEAGGFGPAHVNTVKRLGL